MIGSGNGEEDRNEAGNNEMLSGGSSQGRSVGYDKLSAARREFAQMGPPYVIVL